MKLSNHLMRIAMIIMLLTAGVGTGISYAQANGLLGTFKVPHLAVNSDTLTTEQEILLIDMLDSSLGSLADQDRQGRMIGGYVLLGLGTASAVGGAVTLVVGEGDDARIVGYSLLGGSVLLSGLSLVPFKIKSGAENLYAEFSQELGETTDQNRQKYYYWDRRFEELAEKSRRGRVIGGITSIVAGGVTSLVFVEGPGESNSMHSSGQLSVGSKVLL